MKTFKAFFIVAVAIYIVMVLFKLMPVYMDYLGFKDDVEQAARVGSYTPRGPDAIRNDVQRSLMEHDIPMKPEDVDIEKNGANVSITADYTEHVDIPLHPVDLHFHVAFDSTGQIGEIPR